tara:strand:- start:68 stop:688 length:621 start_codon:yes stop_codon:yes gene_type:complete
MVTYGRIDHIVQKIKDAKTPDRFTNDFLKEVIQAKGSNDRAFISLAKRCGLLNQDGSPTDRYKRLRSTTQSVSKTAMAEAVKSGYADLYALNEYVHKLSEKDLEGLVLQLTGDEKGSATVNNIVKTFLALRKHADFDVGAVQVKVSENTEEKNQNSSDEDESNSDVDTDEVKLGLSYQINLILPKTDDIAVFNAIFRSLKENLLKK